VATVLREHTGKEAVDPSRRPPDTTRSARQGFQSRGSRALLLLMLPGLGYFLVFHYGALLGNLIAFKDYVPFDGIRNSLWVGTENFQRMFEDGEFWESVLNTLWIALLQLVFYFPVPLALALLLHSLTWTTVRRFVQSVAYLPHFISWVIVVALFQQVLGDTGMVNSYLGDAGLHSVDIIGNPDLFRPLTVAQVIWKDAGWGTIIFLAAGHHPQSPHGRHRDRDHRGQAPALRTRRRREEVAEPGRRQNGRGIAEDYAANS